MSRLFAAFVTTVFIALRHAEWQIWGMGFFSNLFRDTASGRNLKDARNHQPVARAPLAVAGGMAGTGEKQHFALGDVFTPTRPQRSLRRLTGRQSELARIFRALMSERAHVVLYGERGRGKTSIVNLVTSAARSSGYMVARCTCSAESEFDDIVRGLARELPPPLLAVPVRQGGDLQGCEAALPAGRILPQDVVALPGRLTGRHLILIVDEFDRIEDARTRTRFADTIKQVSDRGVPLSFVIVGVSDSLDELLGRHPSIQRNIFPVPLPLLTDDQVEEILILGGSEAGVEFPPDIRQSIVSVARGLPYFAQLLGLHAGMEALARHDTNVNAADLAIACMRALDEIDPRVPALYGQLTARGGDPNARTSLLAVASGEQDRFGRFSALETVDGYIVAGAPVSREQWSRMVETGAIRPCRSAGVGIFAFCDSMLQQYILLRNVVGTRARIAVTTPSREAISR